MLNTSAAFWVTRSGCFSGSASLVGCVNLLSQATGCFGSVNLLSQPERYVLFVLNVSAAFWVTRSGCFGSGFLCSSAGNDMSIN